MPNKPKVSKLGSVGQSVVDFAQSQVSKYKKNKQDKQNVINSAIKEGENIFRKTQPNMAMKDGSWPKVDKDNAFSPYGKAATKVENQVVKARLAQYKNKKNS